MVVKTLFPVILNFRCSFTDKIMGMFQKRFSFGKNIYRIMDVR
jgi:hypothetical protein